MKAAFVFLAIVLVFSASPCAAVYGQGVSSDELITNYRLYEGKVVSFSGEVVGEVMNRGDYSWINVSDGSNAIGVWISSALSNQVQSSGSYKNRGDWIEVTGVFNHSCSLHGGDLDIHAQTFRRVNPGGRLEERLNSGKAALAVILGAILCLVMILVSLKKK